MIEKEVENIFRSIFKEIGDDPNRESLRETPARFINFLRNYCSGYNHSLSEIFDKSIEFNSSNQGMVVFQGIEFYSLCEHHLLPFFGKCHIAYVPNGKLAGLSKFTKVVGLLSKRLQIQERLNQEVANLVFTGLSPLGVGVVIEGKHLCVNMRDSGGSSSTTIVTSHWLGCFEEVSYRNEFYSHLRR